MFLRAEKWRLLEESTDDVKTVKRTHSRMRKVINTLKRKHQTLKFKILKDVPDTSKLRRQSSFLKVPKHAQVPQNAQLDTFTFPLFREMKGFYKFVSSMIKLPALQLQSWFEPFVDRFINRCRHQFRQILPKILLNETWTAQDAKTQFVHCFSCMHSTRLCIDTIIVELCIIFKCVCVLVSLSHTFLFPSTVIVRQYLTCFPCYISSAKSSKTFRTIARKPKSLRHSCVRLVCVCVFCIASENVWMACVCMCTCLGVTFTSHPLSHELCVCYYGLIS